MKPILLTISGTSPQIITETLFAMNAEQQPWPEEIYVITTSVGKQKIERGLKDEKHLERLCNEINKPEPEMTIWVIPDANGNEVEDARSREDHEALANFIMEKTRELTANNDTQLHTSIAGGRKTMTYYMGYAMSLFGRKQDKLSHVLVTDGYENLADFYYPSKAQDPITHKMTFRGKEEIIPAKIPSEAEVILADIPFIRMRNNLSSIMKKLGEEYNFRDLIDLINIAPSPEDYRFIIDIPNQVIRISDNQGNIVVDNKIESTFAFIWYVVIARTMKDDSLLKITNPGKGNTDDILGVTILNELISICGAKPIDTEQYSTFKEILDIQTDTLDQILEKHPKRKVIFTSVEKINDNKGIGGQWFNDRKHDITEALKNNLPADLLAMLVPKQNFEDIDRYYFIDLPKECIEIIEL